MNTKKNIDNTNFSKNQRSNLTSPRNNKTNTNSSEKFLRKNPQNLNNDKENNKNFPRKSTEFSKEITREVNKKPQNFLNANSNFEENNQNENQIENENGNTFIKDLDDIQKLKRLFLIYSGNEKKMQSQKFLKLVQDADLLDQDFDNKYADILFFAGSKSKNSIDFNNFCDIIMKITEIKTPMDFIKNEIISLNNLLNEYLFPLLNKIYKGCSLKKESLTGFYNSTNNNKKGLAVSCHLDYTNLILKLTNNLEIKETIQKHIFLLMKIYKKYFPWENLKIPYEKKAALSERGFLRFCKDFEINPNLISLIKLNEIYTNSTLNNKLINSICVNFFEENQIFGEHFMIFNFVICVYLISIQGLLIKNSAQSNNNSNRNSYSSNFRRKSKENFNSNNNINKEFASFDKEKNDNKIPDYELNDFLKGEDIKLFNELLLTFYNSEAIKDVITKDSETEKLNKEYFNSIKNEKKKEFPCGKFSNSENNFRKSNRSNAQNQKSLVKAENILYVKNQTKLELEYDFFQKYKDILLSVYKFYSNSLSESASSVFMSITGFKKFLREANLLSMDPKEKLINYSLDFPFKMSVTGTKKFSSKTPLNKNTQKELFNTFQANNFGETFRKKNSDSNNNNNNNNNNKNFLQEKINEKTLTFDFVNLLFSKFSSEIIIRKENDNYKKCKIQSVKNVKDPNIQSNKRINFKSFVKLLICISNKIFNPEFSACKNSEFFEENNFVKEKNVEISKLLSVEIEEMQVYLENFILNYLNSLYFEAKNFFENEANDFEIFEKIADDENVELFVQKIKPVFLGIFKFYTDSNECMYFEEFNKFCHDYEIFPDLISKNLLSQLYVNFISDYDDYIFSGDPNFFIDYNRFIQILIYISLKTKLFGQSENNSFKRILFFVQRVIQSKGLKIFVRETGSSKYAQDLVNIFSKYVPFLQEKKEQKKTFKDLVFLSNKDVILK